MCSPVFDTEPTADFCASVSEPATMPSKPSLSEFFSLATTASLIPPSSLTWATTVFSSVPPLVMKPNGPPGGSPFGSDGLSGLTGPPVARSPTSLSEVSNWSYRCWLSAIVVTVPITAHTTAMSATAETTSRVRSVRGCRRRCFRSCRRPLMTPRA